LLLALASAVILGSKHHGAQDLTVSDSRLSQPGGPRSLYLYPPATGRLSYIPKALGYLHFVSNVSQGYSGIRTQFHPGTLKD
jgi:hypothetical protein